MFEELKPLALQGNQKYIYILLFNSNNIKIGVSSNPYQRFNSLSNSNGGGYKIIKYYLSPSTYIWKTLEKYMHELFKDYRLEGEFFNKTLSFATAVDKLNEIINSAEYLKSNEIRKQSNLPYAANTAQTY